MSATMQTAIKCPHVIVFIVVFGLYLEITVAFFYEKYIIRMEP